jgi:two-component system sensor histidine kinase/response regulator
MEMLKVLIVDDEEGMGRAVQRALTHYCVHLPEMERDIGFEVIHALTGEQALEMVRTLPPDILLLDHKLPGITGLDILAQLSAAPADLLTVMITAYASLENAVLATKRGAFDFLAKPFTPDELKAVVYKTAKHLLLQRQARQLASEKRKLRFEFISILAHELKAPLAAVEQYLAILGEMVVPKDQKQILTRSILRIQGMRKMILDLLDLTRIESGQRPRLLEELELGQLVSGVVDTLNPLAREKKVVVELHIPAPIRFKADRWEMETMIGNLLSNALKYNRQEGRVDIDVQQDQDRVQISFRDTGIGIQSEAAQNLFREFSRIRTAATEQIPGSGLGLSIVKKIASLYQGDIQWVSQSDRGSTFTLMLSSC